MGRRHFKPVEIVANLREIDVRLSKGETTCQALRVVGITAQTYYRWRLEYGGPNMGQAKRVKELEREMSSLRKSVST